MHDDVSAADHPDAMSGVLAMFMAAQSRPDPNGIRLLDDLDAFASIGVAKSRFLRIVEHYRQGPCQGLAKRNWLALDDWEVLDDLLAGVRDPRNRLLLCRLAGCVVMADGRRDEVERQIYDHMLLRWGYTPSSVAQAILAHGVHRTGMVRVERI